MSQIQFDDMGYTFNKKLIEDYPWLLPRNRFTGEFPESYHYEYTLLDDIPKGWRKAFGLMMVAEIDDQLRKEGEDIRKEYTIYQIEEKYGELRWYDNGSTKVQEIIDKYCVISRNVCIYCGKPDTPIVIEGWISPICKDCYDKHAKQRKTQFNINSLPYERMIDKESPIIEDSYTRRQFSGTDSYDITYDISETVNKVRQRYKELQK